MGFNLNAGITISCLSRVHSDRNERSQASSRDFCPSIPMLMEAAADVGAYVHETVSVLVKKQGIPLIV